MRVVGVDDEQDANDDQTNNKKICLSICSPVQIRLNRAANICLVQVFEFIFVLIDTNRTKWKASIRNAVLYMDMQIGTVARIRCTCKHFGHSYAKIVKKAWDIQDSSSNRKRGNQREEREIEKKKKTNGIQFLFQALLHVHTHEFCVSIHFDVKL